MNWTPKDLDRDNRPQWLKDEEKDDDIQVNRAEGYMSRADAKNERKNIRRLQDDSIPLVSFEKRHLTEHIQAL